MSVFIVSVLWFLAMISINRPPLRHLPPAGLCRNYSPPITSWLLPPEMCLHPLNRPTRPQDMSHQPEDIIELRLQYSNSQVNTIFLLQVFSMRQPASPDAPFTPTTFSSCHNVNCCHRNTDLLSRVLDAVNYSGNGDKKPHRLSQWNTLNINRIFFLPLFWLRNIFFLIFRIFSIVHLLFFSRPLTHPLWNPRQRLKAWRQEVDDPPGTSVIYKILWLDEKSWIISFLQKMHKRYVNLEFKVSVERCFLTKSPQVRSRDEEEE